MNKLSLTVAALAVSACAANKPLIRDGSVQCFEDDKACLSYEPNSSEFSPTSFDPVGETMGLIRKQCKSGQIFEWVVFDKCEKPDGSAVDMPKLSGGVPPACNDRTSTGINLVDEIEASFKARAAECATKGGALKLQATLFDGPTSKHILPRNK